MISTIYFSKSFQYKIISLISYLKIIFKKINNNNRTKPNNELFLYKLFYLLLFLSYNYKILLLNTL